MTVPETPPPDMQQDFNGPTVAASRAASGAAPGRHVDDSPSKPRASKSHRTLGMFSGEASPSLDRVHQQRPH